MKLERLATITLSNKILIGEWTKDDAVSYPAKPGNYHVYRVSELDDKPFTVLFVNHVDNEQDFGAIATTMDLMRVIHFHGGMYGVLSDTFEPNASKNEKYDQWETVLDEGSENGFVSYTEYGNSPVAVFTNSERSAFLFDDIRLYLKTLIQREVDARNLQAQIHTNILMTQINFVTTNTIRYCDFDTDTFTIVTGEPKDGERMIDVLTTAVVDFALSNDTE